MFAATQRWFRRNKTPIAIGVGLLGAGYAVTHYVLNKLNDARERMSAERIAKENLRRRFQQNQEDCTYTVLALLPNAATRILESMNVERITLEIQRMKTGSAPKSVKSGSGDSISLPDTIAITDGDGRSIVSTSESAVHVSEVIVPRASQDGHGDQQPELDKPKRTKRQLWGDVTISSITRAFTLIYVLALLTMLTRVQLNLLGRRSYLSSVVSLATGSNTATISLQNNDDDSTSHAYGDDFEVNRKYLTLSWWLLNKGWLDVAQRVEDAVRRVFGQTSPRNQLTLETFSAMTSQVRRLVEGSEAFSDPMTTTTASAVASGAPTKWLPFILPPPDMEEYVLKESGILDDSAASATEDRSGASPLSTSSASLRRLLDETSDLIETPTFSHVMTQILDAGFATLVEINLAQGAFEMPAPPASSETTGGPSAAEARQTVRSQTKVLLPKCLSVLTRQAHAIGAGMPNEYLQAMEAVRALEAFSALVYSSNWENEARDEPMPVTRQVSSVTIKTSTAADQAAATGAPVPQAPGPSQDGAGSLVLVDPSQSSFESVWARTSNKVA